ncbi:hypothetical protein [Natrarchaeobius oligotrophus]|uniref:Uncharacterized protein n=1 Tax=Natrarchaeobius chitinivorans TaxID=1679083 RepID=A0A3N6MFL8_NATCH|nr:hypothetical protein [Natrarchaeobius chitinivorans]RQG99744.1 hypothetical protein EA472_13910 [Natrarchaeobius chitinivorans]
MSFTDRSSPGSLARSTSLHRADSIENGDRIRHVDQLEGETLQLFLELLDGGRSTVPATCGLERGDVIVFTDYYRIAGG